MSGATRGEEPPDVLPDGPVRRRVVFDMESVDAEALFAAIALLRAEARAHGDEVDDSAALATLARQAMAATAPITAEPYRTVLHTCPTCAAATCGDHAVSDTVAAEAACDAEIVDLTEGPERGHLTRTVAPARRRAVLARDRERCVVPGCSSRRWLHLHGRLALERLPDRRWRAEHADGRVAVGPPE